MPPERLSYRLIRRVAAHGAVEVYFARLADGRPVAVKRVRLDPTDSPAERTREADIAGQLEHPSIVHLLAVEEGDEYLSLIFEWIHGVDLARIFSAGRLSCDAAIYLASELFCALDYAHTQAGVIHRDVSPQNVMIEWSGRVVLTDFGISKRLGSPRTTGIHVRGKLGYMSPEHYEGLELDARSDLFAVGVLLYEGMAGRKPFGDRRQEIVSRLLGTFKITPLPQVRPDIAPALAEVVAGLLERERARRYPTAREARMALPCDAQGRAELVALLRRLDRFGGMQGWREQVTATAVPHYMPHCAHALEIAAAPQRRVSAAVGFAMGVIAAFVVSVLLFMDHEAPAADRLRLPPPAATHEIVRVDDDAAVGVSEERVEVEPSLELSQPLTAPKPKRPAATARPKSKAVTKQKLEQDLAAVSRQIEELREPAMLMGEARLAAGWAQRRDIEIQRSVRGKGISITATRAVLSDQALWLYIHLVNESNRPFTVNQLSVTTDGEDDHAQVVSINSGVPTLPAGAQGLIAPNAVATGLVRIAQPGQLGGRPLTLIVIGGEGAQRLELKNLIW
ncbi:MAG: serine/threonine-protein kinase [Myxococcota bacterium]